MKWHASCHKLACLALVALACASPTPDTPREPWEARLTGDAIVLLGEVHDNAEHHRLRLAVLRRAFEAGWRPALALEPFDRERQPEIERARRERPGDAAHVVALAAPPGDGWRWAYYTPYVELALAYDVPLVAANLSREDVRRVVRGGFGAVFSPDEQAALGLDRAVPADLAAAQEREIDVGHCGMLPPEHLAGMARGQLARDAVLAAALRAHAARGVVLLAGDGHVRRDLGVPRWLGAGDRARTLAVGYLEDGDVRAFGAAFDAVVVTPAAEREDPCAVFRSPPH